MPIANSGLIKGPTTAPLSPNLKNDPNKKKKSILPSSKSSLSVGITKSGTNSRNFESMLNMNSKNENISNNTNMKANKNVNMVVGKKLLCKVQLLDDSIIPFQIPARAVGKTLFDEVCQSLNLLECDYFGLEYEDAEGNKCWLDPDKVIAHQIESINTSLRQNILFKFCVKFYTPDPTQLEEEYTRYLFCLQLKRDLADGSLPCSDNTSALLASYIVQADCGDYSSDEYPDHTYLSAVKFFPKQNPLLEKMIMENHKKHAGQTPAEADMNFLDIARRVEMYGIKLHPAQDHDGVGLMLAVAHMGILVYQNNIRINTFSWVKIRKLSFKRKKFLIKLHPEEFGYYKDTVEFYFKTRNQSKNFWKKCIEYHTFFRMPTNQMIKRSVSSGGPLALKKDGTLPSDMIPQQRHKKSKLFSKGSSFRYSGRTQKEVIAYVRDCVNKRKPFTRSISSQLSKTGSPKTVTCSIGVNLSKSQTVQILKMPCTTSNGTPNKPSSKNYNDITTSMPNTNTSISQSIQSSSSPKYNLANTVTTFDVSPTTTLNMIVPQSIVSNFPIFSTNETSINTGAKTVSIQNLTLDSYPNVVCPINTSIFDHQHTVYTINDRSGQVSITLNQVNSQPSKNKSVMQKTNNSLDKELSYTRKALLTSQSKKHPQNLVNGQITSIHEQGLCINQKPYMVPGIKYDYSTFAEEYVNNYNDYNKASTESHTYPTGIKLQYPSQNGITSKGLEIQATKLKPRYLKSYDNDKYDSRNFRETYYDIKNTNLSSQNMNAAGGTIIKDERIEIKTPNVMVTKIIEKDTPQDGSMRKHPSSNPNLCKMIGRSNMLSHQYMDMKTLESIPGRYKHQDPSPKLPTYSQINKSLQNNQSFSQNVPPPYTNFKDFHNHQYSYRLHHRHRGSDRSQSPLIGREIAQHGVPKANDRSHSDVIPRHKTTESNNISSRYVFNDNKDHGIHGHLKSNYPFYYYKRKSGRGSHLSDMSSDESDTSSSSSTSSKTNNRFPTANRRQSSSSSRLSKSSDISFPQPLSSHFTVETINYVPTSLDMKHNLRANFRQPDGFNSKNKAKYIKEVSLPGLNPMTMQKQQRKLLQDDIPYVLHVRTTPKNKRKSPIHKSSLMLPSEATHQEFFERNIGGDYRIPFDNKSFTIQGLKSANVFSSYQMATRSQSTTVFSSNTHVAGNAFPSISGYPIRYSSSIKPSASTWIPPKKSKQHLSSQESFGCYDLMGAPLPSSMSKDNVHKANNDIWGVPTVNTLVSGANVRYPTLLTTHESVSNLSCKFSVVTPPIREHYFNKYDNSGRYSVHASPQVTRKNDFSMTNVPQHPQKSTSVISMKELANNVNYIPVTPQPLRKQNSLAYPENTERGFNIMTSRINSSSVTDLGIPHFTFDLVRLNKLPLKNSFSSLDHTSGYGGKNNNKIPTKNIAQFKNQTMPLMPSIVRDSKINKNGCDSKQSRVLYRRRFYYEEFDDSLIKQKPFNMDNDEALILAALVRSENDLSQIKQLNFKKDKNMLDTSVRKNLMSTNALAKFTPSTVLKRSISNPARSRLQEDSYETVLKPYQSPFTYIDDELLNATCYKVKFIHDDKSSLWVRPTHSIKTHHVPGKAPNFITNDRKNKKRTRTKKRSRSRGIMDKSLFIKREDGKTADLARPPKELSDSNSSSTTYEHIAPKPVDEKYITENILNTNVSIVQTNISKPPLKPKPFNLGKGPITTHDVTFETPKVTTVGPHHQNSNENNSTSIFYSDFASQAKDIGRSPFCSDNLNPENTMSQTANIKNNINHNNNRLNQSFNLPFCSKSHPFFNKPVHHKLSLQQNFGNRDSKLISSTQQYVHINPSSYSNYIPTTNFIGQKSYTQVTQVKPTPIYFNKSPDAIQLKQLPLEYQTKDNTNAPSHNNNVNGNIDYSTNATECEGYSDITIM